MGRTVLVADDEPLTAEMVAVMLEFRGYDVICVNDGAEALRQALARKPDVIILDVLMPGLEGVAVTRALRCDEELCRRPVVLFSSADEGEIEWREAGADVFLQKPIDIRLLPELVDRLLSQDKPPPAHIRAA